MTAYKARNISQLLSGLDIYMSELTVMPPSWDTNIRLDPPKTSTTREEREKARKEIKDKKKREKAKMKSGFFRVTANCFRAVFNCQLYLQFSLLSWKTCMVW